MVYSVRLPTNSVRHSNAAFFAESRKSVSFVEIISSATLLLLNTDSRQTQMTVGRANRSFSRSSSSYLCPINSNNEVGIPKMCCLPK